MDTSKIWLISDTHFYHSNIIKFCDRPFNSIKEMNETLIRNWNSTVGKSDRVFMLGDFALCGKDKIIEIGQQLNGRKTLILGNHDGASLKTYYEAGFEIVSRYPILFKDFIILSHMPQFITSNGLYANIHGHVHNHPEYLPVTSHTFNVSAEMINYTPINWEQIMDLMEQERKKKIEKETESLPNLI